MVDVYGVDPMRAGAVIYALMVQGKYKDHKPTTDVAFVVHGETGSLRG